MCDLFNQCRSQLRQKSNDPTSNIWFQLLLCFFFIFINYMKWMWFSDFDTTALLYNFNQLNGLYLPDMCDSAALQWGCEKHRPRVIVWISTCRDDMQVPASSRTSTRSGCGRMLMFNSVSELQELWQSCLKALARPNTSESLNVAAQIDKHKSLLHRRIMCHLVLSCLSISKILL